MKTSLSLVAVLALSVVGAARIAAQEHARPQGFWIAVGAGYSSLGVSCDGCSGTTREDGIAGQVRLGTTLRSSLLVGADVETWNKTEGGKWAKTASVTAAVYWYPIQTTGLYLKGGVGLATINGTISGYSVSGSGVGFTGGLGYDVPLSRSFWLTPTASYFYGSVGDLNTGSVGVVKGWKQNAFNLALNLTFP